MKNTVKPAFNRKVHYRDTWIRVGLSLLGAHWIVSFGEPESIFELFLMRDYWRSLFGSAVIAYALLSLVRWICLKLDRWLDWREHPVARPFAQLGAGIGLLCLVAYLLAAIYFVLHGMDIRDTVYIELDWPLIIAQLFIANLYYLVYYIVVVWKHSQSSESKNEKPHYRQVIIVQVAAKNIPVKVGDIAYFFRQNDENFLRTKAGVDYLISESLDYYEQALDPLMFFRSNRKFIVSFAASVRFENIENDKLELFVIPSYTERIIISQKRAPAFRKWMNR